MVTVATATMMITTDTPAAIIASEFGGLGVSVAENELIIG